MANGPYPPPAAPIVTRREQMLRGTAVVTLLAVIAYALNNTSVHKALADGAQAGAKASSNASQNFLLIYAPAALVFGIARAAYNNSAHIYQRTANWFAGFFQAEPVQDNQANHGPQNVYNGPQ